MRERGKNKGKASMARVRVTKNKTHSWPEIRRGTDTKKRLRQKLGCKGGRSDLNSTRQTSTLSKTFDR